MNHPLFAEVVFPLAVAQSYTYAIPASLADSIEVGKRVWVSFNQNKSIGLITKLHSEQPNTGFKVLPIEGVLDKNAIVSKTMIQLIEWLSTYYYASIGLCVQAALPSGLNFNAQDVLRIKAGSNPFGLGKEATQLYDAVLQKQYYPLDEAQKRWGNNKVVDKMIKDGLIERWQIPVQPLKPPVIKWVQLFDQWNKEDIIANYLQEDGKKRPKWKNFLADLLAYDADWTYHNIQQLPSYSTYAFNKCKNEGLIHLIEKERFPKNKSYKAASLYIDEAAVNELNENQKAVYKKVKAAYEADAYECFLLHGITGSGKTEVYIHNIMDVLKAGKQALVLVPEIALTPQTVRRFTRVFGAQVATLHSRMSDRERLDTWYGIRAGAYNVVIGARSAVFAPLDRLGIIVVDEEHDGSYKQQDPAPRYHARDVAIMRAFNANIPIVLGSATPALVSYNNALNGKYTLVELNQRHADAKLPQVEIVDLKAHRHSMRGPMSAALYFQLKSCLEEGNQAILLLNRRGFASYLRKVDNGEIIECPNCSVSLTYHKKSRNVRCHYCGYSRPLNYIFKQYGADNIEEGKDGTQRVEEEIQKYFNEARLLRMDQDTTAGSDAHRAILDQFASGKADILIGTQMVAKGLDFPNVTLVGVLNADTELAFPYFGAPERMYQLLSQVSGRSGRSGKTGKVLLQTWQPDNEVIIFAKHHDYTSFAQFALNQRKELLYPPFSRLILFTYKSKNATMTAEVAEAVHQQLAKRFGETYALGPSPAVISRVQKEFVWESLIKIDPKSSAKVIHRYLDAVLEEGLKGLDAKVKNQVRINITIDVM